MELQQNKKQVAGELIKVESNILKTFDKENIKALFN